MTAAVSAGSLPWLIVASEERELAGIAKRRLSRNSHAAEMLLASGPGPRLVNEALREKRNVAGIVSVGFCGALDPALEIGDILVAGEGVESARRFLRGEILSVDRVIVTAAEKRAVRAKTGAIAVEMESAAAEAKAREWGLPFRCIKAVSDTAGDDMPLDFNAYRDAQGRFRRPAIARAALRHPFTILPGLMRLEANCRKAAEKLGEFLGDCTF